ncbi:hypothetical protein [Actinomycetospora sp. TBRC 11914]|uniref:hypothetical protein n=1 Tax=Actinomycetospora sp. TBRC 11914 TaxID=2729387 RepID=UPI00145CB709|nr:hypothetical protein [Actinomycetospora sp. TBRC 11914]NMO91192.1 hypothetical protein [Actinomycetospora sp. TBRC 11914]
MRRGRWAAEMGRIREAAVDDTIHVRTLMGLGMPESTIYRWCQDDGPWTLMAPATVRLSTGTPTRRQLVRAGLVYAGDRALLTGLDAARAHLLRRGELPAAVHLLVPAGMRVQSTPTIRVERTTRLRPAIVRDELPVAPVERCVLDAARRMRDRSDIAAILTEPVQRRMLLVGTLLEELDAGSQRGSATPRAVLRAAEDGARSAAEFDFHAWWSEHPDLPQSVVFNVRLSDATGLLGIADAYVPEIGLVLPIDSTEHHFSTADQVVETERQHRAYRSAGLHVYGIRPSRIARDPAGLYQDVLDAIRVAANLPTPLVRWQPDLPRSA